MDGAGGYYAFDLFHLYPPRDVSEISLTEKDKNISTQNKRETDP